MVDRFLFIRLVKSYVVVFVLFVISSPFTLANSAAILLDKADSLSSTKQFNKADIAYHKVAEILKDEGRWDQYISVKNKQMLLYFEMDSLSKAIHFSEELILEAEYRLNVDSDILAMVYHKKGVLHYYNSEDHLAIQYYKKALAIRTKKEKGNIEDIIRGYRNIGDSYYFLGKLDSAKFNLDIAFELIQKNDPANELLKLGVYRLLARIYQMYGDFSKAEEFLSYGINAYENKELVNTEQVEKAVTFSDYGDVLTELYRFKEANKIFVKAIELLEEVPGKNEAALADLFNNMGLCYLKMGEYKKSLLSINKSLFLNKSNSREEALRINYLNISTVKNKLAQYQDALDILTNLLNLDKSDYYDIKPELFDNLGDAYIGLGELENGVESYNKSLAALTKRFIPKNIFDTPDISSIDFFQKDVLVTLASKADALVLLYNQEQDLNYLKASFSTYQKIDTLIFKIRQNFLAENSKLSLVSETKLIYEKAISVSLDLYEILGDKQYQLAAFKFIQKSKSVALSDAIRHTQATSFLNVDYAKEKRLNMKINRFLEKSYSPDGLTLEEEEQFISLKDDKEKFIKDLEESNSAYFDYKYNDTTINNDDLINLIDNETALVEFFVGEEKCYIATFTDLEGLRIHRITLEKKDLEVLVDQLNKAIYSPFNTKENAYKISLKEADDDYAKVAVELYKLLLKPLNIATYTKLIIIPDDILNTLSFDALLTKEVSQESIGYYGNKQDYRYLLYQHDISYNYGISLMQQLDKQQQVVVKNQLIVFNTPEFNGQVDELEDAFGNWNNFFKSLKKGGTKLSFMESAGVYKYIHFSLHGILNNKDPNKSYLRMNSSKKESFEPLYLSTLYNLSINAEMVVTSVCDAGIGENSRGEGVLSLARGFFYAGAKSIITSLWEVKDGYSGNLLKEFYMNLKKGDTKQKALNHAKRNFITQYGDELARPYYWAAFVPIGKMDSVKLPYLMPNWMKVLIGIFAVFSILGIRKRLIDRNDSPVTI